jgi:hypothetical protein
MSLLPEIKTELRYTAKDSLGRDVAGFRTEKEAYIYMIGDRLRALKDHNNYDRDAPELYALLGEYIKKYLKG